MEILTAFVKENLADTLLNGAGIEVDDLDSVTEQLNKVILEKIIWVGILDYIERDTPSKSARHKGVGSQVGSLADSSGDGADGISSYGEDKRVFELVINDGLCLSLLHI